MASDDKAEFPRLKPIEDEPVAVKGVIGGPGLPMNRYYFWVPTFCKEKDVEQFIAEFSNVAGICRWPTRVILIQLLLCLIEMAKPYKG